MNPVTDTISIPILSDDVVEMEETFGLELTISAGMDLQLGNISQATVSITDVNRKCDMQQLMSSMVMNTNEGGHLGRPLNDGWIFLSYQRKFG